LEKERRIVMEIVYKKVNELIPYINNSRTHSEEQVNQIVASINEFGFTNPLLIDEKDNIIAGHGRLLASKKLKMEEVPCIVLSGLTEAQKKAYIIADNKMALNAGWDDELLKIELENLKELDFDLELTGFNVDELDDIFQVEEEQEIVEDDFDIEPPEEPKAKLGDIYQLGNHRLMCGDSTSEEDVEKLMNGNKADMVFTDPPYNIAYSGIKDKRTIENDKMNDEDFVDFLEKSIMKCDTAYVCCSWQYEHLFKKAMTNIGMAPKAMIIWNKVNPAQHLDKYFKQHEIIFYYGKFGGEKTIRGDIWECKRQKNTVHPTMKPIELIAMALGDNKDKEIVYDGFGGSGSTLIACEQLNRNCYMMELDEHYASVIIERYINFTGNDVYRLNPDGTKTNWRDIKCEKEK
jgi:DNA modification methylase